MGMRFGRDIWYFGMAVLYVIVSVFCGLCIGLIVNCCGFTLVCLVYFGLMWGGCLWFRVWFLDKKYGVFVSDRLWKCEYFLSLWGWLILIGDCCGF
jgi:hypothetical protein